VLETDGSVHERQGEVRIQQSPEAIGLTKGLNTFVNGAFCLLFLQIGFCLIIMEEFV